MRWKRFLAVVPVLLLCNAMDEPQSHPQSAPHAREAQDKVFTAPLLRNIATYLQEYAAPSEHCSLLTPYRRCSDTDKNQLALKVVQKQIHNELDRIDGPASHQSHGHIDHQALTVLFDRHIRRYVVNNLVKSVLVKYDLWEEPAWFGHMYEHTPVPVAFVPYMDAACTQPLDIRTLMPTKKAPCFLGTIAAEMIAVWAKLGFINQPKPIHQYGTAETVDDSAEATVIGSFIRKRGTDQRQHEYGRRNEEDMHGIFDLNIFRESLEHVQQEVAAGRYPPFFKIEPATEEMMGLLDSEPKGDSDDKLVERSDRFHKLHGPHNKVDY